jgi:histone arginine demethylase JMJD6
MFHVTVAEAIERVGDDNSSSFATERIAEWNALPSRLCASCGPVASEDGAALRVADFVARYERPSVPVLLTGTTDVSEDTGRPGGWSVEALAASFGNAEAFMLAGEDPPGSPVMVGMGDFAAYASRQQSDSPLYVFDASFACGTADSEGNPTGLLADVRVPRFFPNNPGDAGLGSTASPWGPPDPARLRGGGGEEGGGEDGEENGGGEKEGGEGSGLDLLSYLGEDRRPPYRWLLVGPERSGSMAHVDPFGTAAWNTVLDGQK